MSSSGRTRRRFLVRHPAVVDLGCSCRRVKLSSLFSSPLRKAKPKPNSPSSPKHHHHDHPLSSYYPFTPSATTSATSPWETSRHPSSISTTTASPYDEPMPEAGTPKVSSTRGAGRVGESVAVVKESDDPYKDFRESMLQMILEKEIYAWEDLQELLTSFLSLNSPCHHDIIVRAFTEIWGGAFSSAAGSPGPSAAGSYGKHGRQRGHGGVGVRRRRHLPRAAA